MIRSKPLVGSLLAALRAAERGRRVAWRIAAGAAFALAGVGTPRAAQVEVELARAGERQWGRHATAFVGRRHFDDPLLLDRYFEVVR